MGIEGKNRGNRGELRWAGEVGWIEWVCGLRLGAHDAQIRVVRWEAGLA